MYRSFSIKNFRGLRDLTLAPLERVNLITGTNNVGKTALLEALFLHLGPSNPELSIRLNPIRGIDWFLADPEEVWGWLFFEKRLNETIELASQEEDGRRRLLTLRLAERTRPQVLSSGNGETDAAKVAGSLAGGPGPRELTMVYKDETQLAESHAYFVEGRLQAERVPISGIPAGVFLSTRARFPREDADRFSKVEQERRQDEVLNPLRALDSRLRRLAVIVSGGMTMVGADIGGDRLIPLVYMGGGMVHLLSMLCAIASAPGGIVLVDEVENGLYHSAMVDVWKAIAHAARRSDTQVFATTHSWECIEAAHEAFSTNPPYDFRLHRLERVGDDVRAVTYDEEMLATARATGLEVR